MKKNTLLDCNVRPKTRQNETKRIKKMEYLCNNKQKIMKFYNTTI